MIDLSRGVAADGPATTHDAPTSRSRRLRAALLCTVLLCSGLPAARAAQADYLSPDLRARVERLKADAATSATTPLNLSARAGVLAQWANAYALSGGTLPVNLTLAVSAVSTYAEQSANQATMIDALIFEMRFRDEQPDALGTLSAEPGPFEAGRFVTLRQVYTVGSRPIQTGGGFLIARHFLANHGVWQTRDAGADNYLSITSSNSRVSFVADTFPMSGMHGGFRGDAPTLVFRLASGTLEPGDTVTITYGDTSGGGRGLQMADFSSDRMPLPIYLAFNQEEPFLTLPIQPVRVSGTEIAGLNGFAPSVVRPGERFTLAVRAQDRHFNRSRDGHPPLSVRNGDTVLASLPESSAAISEVELAFPEPGVYHLTIESADGSLRGEVNPILVSEDAQRIYWGDTHGHSGFAEGIGTPERFMIWARDDARLDYVTHSEHDIWLDDMEWEVLKRNVREFSRDEEFVAFLGYEWTVRNLQGGHHNVLFRTAPGRDRLGAASAPTLSRLYAGLRAANDPADVLIIPHAHQAGDYRQSDPELESLVEIASEHGNFEWFGRMYLRHGHRVGFIAASDDHLSQPGYSAPKNGSLAQRGGLGAVRADSKTADALFDALKALRTYATTGERIILDLSVNDTGPGGRAPFSEDRRIRGRVIGTAPVESVTIFRNDEAVHTQSFLEPADDAGNGAVLVSFESDSAPFHPGDNPRGWRHWRGTLTVRGATLEAADGMDFHNRRLQRIERDPDNPQRLRFSTLTRGDASSIRLLLSEIRRSAMIELAIEPSAETGGAPPLYRPAQAVPGAELALALRDLDDGLLVEPVAAGDYTDAVRVRRIPLQGPKDVTFELDDRSAKQGDYYFVRVRQVNDAQAWSSPVWVGGHPPR